MNNIRISHLSAFYLYRKFRNEYAISNSKLSEMTLFQQSDNLNIDEIYLSLSELCNIRKLDILLNNKNECYSSSKVKRHYYSNPLPKNSFWQISNNAMLVSPELLYCQMSATLDEVDLMLLALELCGSYSINPSEDKGFTSNINSVTTPAKIQNYIKRIKNTAGNFKGIKKAERIAKWLQKGSASPQESRLYIALCAPRYLGGYAIRGMKFNEAIQLSKKASSICGQKILIPDLSICKYKIAIEYDSNYFHDNANQNNKDKRRADAYMHEKWRVYNFVPEQLFNITAFRNLSLDILKNNHQNPRITTRNFYQKQVKLHNRLYKQSIS